MKRHLDVVLSGVGLAIASPAIALFALLIWLQDFRTPFYVAARMARGGGTFPMIKLRSMVVRADQSGVVSTAASDARITPVGHLVRAFKIDEIVQLWNVFKGEMSLVGPRPQVPLDASLYTAEERRLLAVRPGITDLASIVFADEGAILAGEENPDLHYNQVIRPWKSRLALLSMDRAGVGTELWIVGLTALGLVSRRLALAGVQRLLNRWGADQLVCRMASRQEALLPHPPPGADEVVSSLLRLSEVTSGSAGETRTDSTVPALVLRLTAFVERALGNTGQLARLAQVGIVALSGLAAFFLRFEFNVPDSHLRHLMVAVCAWVIVKTVVFRLYGLDRGWWHFVSLPDALRLAMANTAGSIAAGLVIWLAGPAGFPRSVYLLDLMLCLLGTAGIRVVARVLSETAFRKASGAPRTLIYGAESEGALLLKEIQSDRKLALSVCGFIDDDPRKHGLRIHGLEVLGTGCDLTRIAREHGVTEVLIALPRATGAQMTEILRQCHEAGVRSRTIPSPAEVISGSVRVTQLRDVAVEDLLGRKPVELDQEQILSRLEGRVVVVTGAGGSIGSELCRQIARFRPRVLVAFDIAETALFHLQREMKSRFPSLDLRAEVGNIQNMHRLDEVFVTYSPTAVYHAAAYKHVPMMEANIFEAVENNVFGTHNVARVAARHRCETFVLISSDKAVRPTNVMGATKRCAEMVVQSLQDDTTRFVSVRFGNVLGSNGSVVPVFKEQIAAGGPVTVTHPEMRRFFMTIPEAAQLVVQASGMGKGGEIFVLDMGQPVRITDLARDLILLSGLRPDVDVNVEFTGPRPGEKLREELNLDDEYTLPTHHERVKIFSGNPLSERQMAARLEELQSICQYRDAGQLVLLLKKMIPDYNPSPEVLQLAIHNEPLEALSAALSHNGLPAWRAVDDVAAGRSKTEQLAQTGSYPARVRFV
jgi:FlaA1/EpsC-like NDP-sugar epimerase/lipopolysaccharide/colanic/teichoic acid biosynthesis glycosyltransferase